MDGLLVVAMVSSCVASEPTAMTLISVLLGWTETSWLGVIGEPTDSADD